MQEGEIPDIDDPSEIFAMSYPKRSSYSPSKVESMRQAEHDHSNRLSDIVSWVLTLLTHQAHYDIYSLSP